MFKHFYFKKLSYCHQYVFLIACIQPGVALKFLIFRQSEPQNVFLLKMCNRPTFVMYDLL